MTIERRLTVSEASRALGMSRTTLLAAEDAGLLTPLRTPGGHRRYDPAELRRYADRAGAGQAGWVDAAVPEPRPPDESGTADIAAAVRAAVRPLVQVLDADTAGLYLLHDGELRFTAGFGVPRWLAERLTSGPPPAPVVQAFRTRRPCLFDPAAIRFPEPRAVGQGLTVALQGDGSAVGAMFVVTRHDLLPGELRVVDAFRDVLAMLVEDQRRIVDLEHRLARIAAIIEL
ncbi:MerR family DNA-binding transcriptional regulator [Pseudonocardia sp. CA-142604]|uniref:MerR family DNA-binding transcriptional regulator n=1 Tax=Pseudonocardia sp. CA-142604 TaxID=3240024 RepID=UPI003D90F948